MEEIRWVDNYLLELDIHWIAPGKKMEGIKRLICKNLNGINSRLSDNEKLDMARQIIDELEADLVTCNEHCLNLKHKKLKWLQTNV